jgi:quercetin dioxygenase-like cupin family protein
MDAGKSSGDPESLKGRVFAVADLVDYQEGAVVSREIMKGEKGSVTVFAFDKGQGLSEHTAPFDAMVLILDGEAEVVIAGAPLHLNAGEMVIMPANKPHSLHASERFKMALTMIRA